MDAIEEIERAFTEASQDERLALQAALSGRMGRALPAATTLVEVAPPIARSGSAGPRSTASAVRSAIEMIPRPRRSEWAMIAQHVVSGLARRVRAVFA